MKLAPKTRSQSVNEVDVKEKLFGREEIALWMMLTKPKPKRCYGIINGKDETDPYSDPLFGELNLCSTTQRTSFLLSQRSLILKIPRTCTAEL